MKPTTVTLLLQSAREGNEDAAQRLWTSVYDEIRRIAQRAVNDEYGQNSLQATEIAHEAYLKLSGSESLEFESRSHLLATVARAIRRLLVDRARARNADKRGGELHRVLLDDILDKVSQKQPEILDLEIALEELEKVDPRYAKLVELRFFGGMTLEESAATMKVSLRTAAGDWAFAKAWLRRRLMKGLS
ncbi:MAG: ECF-type sigma factor [Pirellulaceae bacterium]|nr:ECF-type sigma factor [Pirellulaceae bacterium]